MSLVAKRSVVEAVLGEKNPMHGAHGGTYVGDFQKGKRQKL